MNKDTCIFSYHPGQREFTLTSSMLVQTSPLKRTYPITKNTLTIGKNPANDVIVHDEYISAFHCRIEFRDQKFYLKDLQSTNGTLLNNNKVLEAEITERANLQIGKSTFEFHVEQEVKKIPVFKGENSFYGMVSKNDSMKDLFSFIETLKESLAPVFIHGETGTGKELVAKAIHENSARKSRPFVSVNCGAIAKDLIESELFGHEKGAFTGATFQREGLFEQAHQGTIFLDEIGELPLELQPKLLRVLETGEIRRVGSSKNIQVDVRIITATHRDVIQEVRNQKFREDLFYRIHVIPISLPPLKDRKEDIELLVKHFLQSRNQTKAVASASMDKLYSYSWPGNVRELKNVIERAIVLSANENEISEKNIRFMSPLESASSMESKPEKVPVTLEEIEKKVILETLKKNNWNKRIAAEKLGIGKSTLHEKVRKYGFNPLS